MKRKTRRPALRVRARSILGRSVLFMITVLSVTLVSADAVTLNSRRMLENEIIARNTVQARAAAEQLTLSLDKSAEMQHALLYDKDINRLGVTPGYYTAAQKTQAILRVNDLMFMQVNSSPLIDRSCFLAPSISKCVTSDSVDPLSDAYFRDCSNCYMEQSSAVTEKDGCYYIVAAYPAYTNFLRKNGACYLLSLRIDMNAVTAFLNAHLAPSEGTVLMFDTKGKAVAGTAEGLSEEDLFRLFSRAGEDGPADLKLQGGKRYLAVYAFSDPFTLVILQPYASAFSALNRQDLFFGGLILLLILTAMAYIVYLWHRIHRPLEKLSDAFRKVEQGDFSLRIAHRRDDDFAYIYRSFNEMNSRLNDLVGQVYLQTIRSQRAELKQLQSQINPHFLYNNLFMIRSLAQIGDTDTIGELADELGNYFRYTARLGRQEVTLLDETEHARAYALIQDRRFSNRIFLDFPPLPESLRSVTVPRLILQPLLENAYGHGLRDIASGGLLRVSYAEEGDDLLIRVENNGGGLENEKLAEMQKSLEKREENEETTALINIHLRLRLRFGEGYGLTLERGEMNGLLVTMRLPREIKEDIGAQDTDR